MRFFGEFIALATAVSWAFSSLFFEFAGKRIGSISVNMIRLLSAFIMLGATLWIITGMAIPLNAGKEAWTWMSLSGLVGFVFGDLVLFYSFILISARFSQLLMTLAPPFAALFGWILIGEKMSPFGYLGMAVTILGIAISVFKRDDTPVAVKGISNTDTYTDNGKKGKIKLHLPLKGVLLGLGGALGQGLGIVLSKLGMTAYAQDVAGDEHALSMIPIAATQIRVITGVIGFALIILFSGRVKSFVKAAHDRRAVGATLVGAIFGPFVGVSLSLMAVQYTNTAVASTIMATTPIIILLPYIFFYKKRISAIEIFGAILSVIGVSLFFLA